MKTDSRPFRPVLAAAPLVFATFLAAGSSVWAQVKPAPKPAAPATAPVVLKDRVLAVVDEDPVLASDVERVIKLGLEQPQPGETDERFRRRVLDALIDQRLQFHEIDRFNFEQVPVDEIQKKVADLRAHFPDEAAFQKALKEVGFDLKGLRQLVARQLLVLTYVDERLGARVFVGPDELNRYYREVLTPAMQKQGRQPPPIEDVREDIRETLKQQKMTQEMGKWTQDLRTKADVVIYSLAQQANQPLPPVVKRIEGKKVDPKAKPASKKPPAI
jgi:peptidyl-prolyl cis-trans isomerase SurA